MKPLSLEKGEKLFKVGDVSTEMYFIYHGVVEIVSTMDSGVDFEIERLYRGSVINHRSFLLSDEIDVIARVASNCQLFVYSIDHLNKLRGKSSALEMRIKMIEENLVDKENAIALDYIISLPRVNI